MSSAVMTGRGIPTSAEVRATNDATRISMLLYHLDREPVWATHVPIEDVRSILLDVSITRLRELQALRREVASR